MEFRERTQGVFSLCIIKLKTLCSVTNNESRNRCINILFFSLSKHVLLQVSAFDCFGKYALYLMYIAITAFPHCLIIIYASVPLHQTELTDRKQVLLISVSLAPSSDE